MKLLLPASLRRALARRREEEHVERLSRGIRRAGGLHRSARQARKDGSPYTKPSLDARRQARRRRNRAASEARKENR